MGEYRVRFEVFEGPLDLLLYLIRKEEVDIYQVNLTRIATEFVEYLNLMRELDLDIAGEFLVMAATLMLIKSRELLPRDQRPEDQAAPEDELDDPRWELIRRLVEYRKFKDAAGRLQQLEIDSENTFPRVPGRIEPPEDLVPPRAEASLFDLLAAVNAVLKRFAERAGDDREVVEDKWSVSEKIESLLSAARQRQRLRFSELFHATTSRAEVVVTFLALLELIRLRMIQALQAAEFSEIEIEWVPPREDPPHNAPPPAACGEDPGQSGPPEPPPPTSHAGPAVASAPNPPAAGHDPRAAPDAPELARWN
jgi:segregation and condensation protein A